MTGVSFLLSEILIAKAKSLFGKKCTKVNNVKKVLDLITKAVFKFDVSQKLEDVLNLCFLNVCVLLSFLEQISTAELMSAPVFT